MLRAHAVQQAQAREDELLSLQAASALGTLTEGDMARMHEIMRVMQVHRDMQVLLQNEQGGTSFQELLYGPWVGIDVQKGALDPSNVPAAHVAPVLGVRGGANAFNPTALVMGMQ